MIFPYPVSGIGFRRLLCRDYVFTVGTFREKEMRSYFCSEGGGRAREGGGGGSYFCANIFLCLYSLSRDSIYRFLSLSFLFFGLSPRLAHKLHTEWFVASPEGGGGLKGVKMYREGASRKVREENSFQRVAAVLD